MEVEYDLTGVLIPTSHIQRLDHTRPCDEVNALWALRLASMQYAEMLTGLLPAAVTDDAQPSYVALLPGSPAAPPTPQASVGPAARPAAPNAPPATSTAAPQREGLAALAA